MENRLTLEDMINSKIEVIEIKFPFDKVIDKNNTIIYPGISTEDIFKEWR